MYKHHHHSHLHHNHNHNQTGELKVFHIIDVGHLTLKKYHINTTHLPEDSICFPLSDWKLVNLTSLQREHRTSPMAAGENWAGQFPHPTYCFFSFRHAGFIKKKPKAIFISEYCHMVIVTNISLYKIVVWFRRTGNILRVEACQLEEDVEMWCEISLDVISSSDIGKRNVHIGGKTY